MDLQPQRRAGPLRAVATSDQTGAVIGRFPILGELGTPYEEGPAAGYSRAADVLMAAGAGLSLFGGRSRLLGRLGAFSALAGAWATRWAVFKAGRQSALDPTATVRPQRERAAQIT